MKGFIKTMLATMAGICLMGFLAFVFTMISLVGMMAAGQEVTEVRDNSVLVIKLQGSVQDYVEEDITMMFEMMNGELENQGLDKILSAVEKAKSNEDIKGIYVEAGAVEFDSPATMVALRRALQDFKKSGKWVMAYGDNMTQSAYYVASVADKVYAHPTGVIDLRGLGGNYTYYKGLYDKLGIHFLAARVGKYKSYVEQNTRTDMSENDREQRTALLEGVWKVMAKDICASRGLNVDQLNAFVNDSLLIFADQNDYKRMRLVDGVVYPEQFRAEVKKRMKLEQDEEINNLSVTAMEGVPGASEREKGEEVAVYSASGDIVDMSMASLTGAREIVGDDVVSDLEKLAKDEDVKAVVLRVNSGGGSAAASEKMWHAVELLKAKKPVVVSMGGAAASGGYMMSCGANYIFAEPVTVTGSIGIFGLVPNISELLTDKLGVTFDGVQTHKNTTAIENLTLKKDTEREMMFLQNSVNRGYDRFLKIVAEGRKKSVAQIHEVAQGRVWLAPDALKVGLVDEIGSLDDAVKKAAQLAKLQEYHTKNYPEPAPWYAKLMEKAEGKSYLDEELKTLLGDQYVQWTYLKTINKRNRIQAVMPYSIKMK